MKFTNYSGEKTRPEFSSVEEMNEELITRHNAVVGQYDKWYCLGDIGMNQNDLDKILPRLNGRKRLILGNHDKFNMSFYSKYFEKVMVSWNPVRSVVFSHYPLVIDENHPKIRANVHGHIHRNEMADKRYLNISVEMINYTPIHWDEIKKKLEKRGIEVT